MTPRIDQHSCPHDFHLRLETPGETARADCGDCGLVFVADRTGMTFTWADGTTTRQEFDAAQRAGWGRMFDATAMQPGDGTAQI